MSSQGLSVVSFNLHDGPISRLLAIGRFRAVRAARLSCAAGPLEFGNMELDHPGRQDIFEVDKALAGVCRSG